MKYVFFAHGGSGNHGCEAIIRSTHQILNGGGVLFSKETQKDKDFGVDRLFDVRQINKIPSKSIRRVYFKLIKLVTRNSRHYYKHIYASVIKEHCNVAFSIGGDNYCYKDSPEQYGTVNIELNKRKIKTVLWGCSVEPEMLKDKKVLDDLKKYSLITARESITYKALTAAGVTKNTKLYPDPAFTLGTAMTDTTYHFIEDKMIGINCSPLIQKLDGGNDITFKNYKVLIQHILDSTECNIALIPHVVRPNNNDLTPLTKLYNEFIDTGRVVLIQEHNCMELKGFISRCRMFIGARTHATIAAYSTCVPTLVMGYSVKAKGIAKDIFGTYENYVIPVQSLRHEDELTNAFKWLSEHEDEIRKHLKEFMPGYIDKAWQAGEEVRKLVEDPDQE